MGTMNMIKRICRPGVCQVLAAVVVVGAMAAVAWSPVLAGLVVGAML